ncbi:hypothetical protein L1889_06985 [Paenalcaligenes niemegkensis]|uniref:J517_1871 family lipoprotein n=1 Tax=Paenalcaligenes niemegkensis TaxID=2895469 RepID=UPI001EE82175|nr:J517_1871 family lipoprotein [Paenalcaligenes niemegkensis]MCQ9616483.1 hypothetical protein [Paenalcaligenes niemegkensis]
MRLLTAISFLIFMAGCMGVTGGSLGSRFDEAMPTPVSPTHAGLWTAVEASDVTTLRIDEDGRGVACSSRDGKDLLSNLKVSDDTLYFQDGLSMALNYGEGYIDGLAIDAESQNVRFVRDDGLQSASPYCRNKLQQPYL